VRDEETLVLAIGDQRVPLGPIATAQYRALSPAEQALVHDGLRRLIFEPERTSRYVARDAERLSRPEAGFLWLAHLLIGFAAGGSGVGVASIHRVTDPRELQ
jgi:hypothetical protein